MLQIVAWYVVSICNYKVVARRKSPPDVAVTANKVDKQHIALKVAVIHHLSVYITAKLQKYPYYHWIKSVGQSDGSRREIPKVVQNLSGTKSRVSEITKLRNSGNKPLALHWCLVLLPLLCSCTQEWKFLTRAVKNKRSCTAISANK